MLTKVDVRQLYNQLAPSYNQLTLMEDYLFGLKRLRRRFFKMASGKVLEVAAGTGKNLPYLQVDDLTQIDLSTGMLTIASQAAKQSGKIVNMAVMGGEALGFVDHAFDTVLSSLSTCTFSDPVTALREMGRVCKTNGQILLLEHGRSKYKWINAYLDRHAERQYQTIGCRWNQEPPKLVEQAGLSIKRIKRYFLGAFYTIEAMPT